MAKKKKSTDTRGSSGEAAPDTSSRAIFSTTRILLIFFGFVFVGSQIQHVMFYMNFDVNALTTGSILFGQNVTAANNVTVSVSEEDTRETGYIPLEELVQTGSPNASMCPPGTFFISSKFVNDTIKASLPPRKIPRIVHISAKIPCMTKAFRDVIERWYLDGHTFAFHDDNAVNRLLTKHFDEFPHMPLAQECLISGAAKADLWRYVVLYEYGGIYSDMDSCPGEKFLTDTKINPNDDAYVAVEGGRFLAQYFISASPKHPLMFTTVMTTLQQLMTTQNVLHQNIPVVTGPGALKIGGIHFMFGDATNFQYPKQGVYTGLDNRTMRVVGTGRTTLQYIVRGCMSNRDEQQGYAAIKQVSFHTIKQHTDAERSKFLNRSCLRVMQELSRTREYDY